MFVAELRAIGLSATLDGLWIEWCLNPETFSPANGLHICRCWVKGLRNGAFSADDVLWRRSKLGLHLGPAQREAVAQWWHAHGNPPAAAAAAAAPSAATDPAPLVSR